MNAPVQIRAPFKPVSLDTKARTVELVASTGAARELRDLEGPFIERLSISKAAVDLSRVDGMPLLDSHRQDGLDRVLGVVRGARIEAGKLIVKVEISKRRDDILEDIAAGIIRNVSIGYTPLDGREGTGADGERVRTVTRWSLVEVSLVPVGADPAAKIRSGNNMPSANPNPANEPETPPEPETRSEPETRPAPEMRTAPETMTRAETNQEIRALAQTAGLPASWSDELIDADATVEQARAAANLAMFTAITRQPNLAPRISQVGPSGDDPNVVVRRMAEATYGSRINPAHEMPAECREFANMTMRDMASACLQMRGVSTAGLNATELFQRALTTSDYPILLQETGDRTLRAGYELAPATIKRASRQSTAKDFRAKHKIQAEDIAELLPVNESGEFKSAKFVEAKESYSLSTAGRVIAFSRQAMVNDDLGAFSDVLARFGQRAAEYENTALVNLILDNAAMADGTAVFHADHGNLAASGGALSVATLSAARLAMRRQTSLSGLPISVAPKYLLVPPELETDAETLLASIQPTTTAEVNPFGGKLELLVEARFTDAAAWYLAADAALVEGIEYSYLAGEEGPQTDSRVGWEVDGFEFKVRLDFGAAFIDHRGWYRNPGA